jgi:hypothetical protein
MMTSGFECGARATRGHGTRSIMRHRRESALTAVNFVTMIHALQT